MTEKQKRFCEEYLIDCNATRAYKAAYPNIKRQHTAETNGNRLLRNAEVQKYIEDTLGKIRSDKIADITEIMEYLTAVMRREKKEYIVVTLTDEISNYVPDERGIPRKQTIKKETPQIVEIPAKLSDANKAAELLGKRFGIFKDNINIDGAVPVVITGEDELEE